jgi:hypothetical protein
MFTNARGLLAARAAQRARVGQGQFGQVFEKAPGLVVKEIPLERKQTLLNEINTQAKAAELGIAPKIQEAYIGSPQAFGRTVPPGPGPNPEMRGEITMQDLRQNYVPLGVNTGDNMGHYRTPDFTGGPNPGQYIESNPALSQIQAKMAEVDTHKQLAQLALNNINLSDRHKQNIFVNKISNRPMQIDFGLAEPIQNVSQQAAVLSMHVTNGLKAAGLEQEANVLNGLVQEAGQLNLETRQFENPRAALDIAKQGLSRLQKLKIKDVAQIQSVLS